MGRLALVVTVNDRSRPAVVVDGTTLTGTGCAAADADAVNPAIVPTTSPTIHCCSVGRDELTCCSTRRAALSAAMSPSDRVCECSDTPECWDTRIERHNASTSTEIRIEAFTGD